MSAQAPIVPGAMAPAARTQGSWPRDDGRVTPLDHAPGVSLAAPTGGDGFDLFDIGRRAALARDTRMGGCASFVRARQLLETGAWRGPRDASESYVEASDLAAMGGFAAAAEAGVRLLVGGGDLAAHRSARALGARSIWRLPFRSGDTARDRHDGLLGLRALLREDIALWGVMPTPEGEPEGLDTLRLVATLRLELPEVPHIVVDVARLGPRLAQMALGFGADELWAPIVSERALRVGGNADNPAMTRKEAAVLIRGAGLIARERLTPDSYGEDEGTP